MGCRQMQSIHRPRDRIPLFFCRGAIPFLAGLCHRMLPMASADDSRDNRITVNLERRQEASQPARDHNEHSRVHFPRPKCWWFFVHFLFPVLMDVRVDISARSFLPESFTGHTINHESAHAFFLFGAMK